MIWRGKKLTVVEAEELYLMYNNYSFFADEGTLALEFWSSCDSLDKIEGFWDYVGSIIYTQQGPKALTDFRRSVANF